MNLRTFTASTLWLALCGAAVAADSSPALQKCLDAANTTAAMVSCNVEQTRIQDLRLNNAYKAALDAQGQRKQQLQDVQRLWIKYRDANCAFVGSATGASIDQVNGSGCVLDMTQTRAEELENLVGP
ncbi:lysozyme inhibitor LprI family protein [Pseudomonas sp. WMBT8]|uniref:lysozyme inhibitor LprI family protein n=1 Tax=Pseudomonas sp. WMBT8 TaxID=3414496 RepID=UPI003D80909B